VTIMLITYSKDVKRIIKTVKRGIDLQMPMPLSYTLEININLIELK
jgi:hypothetical protein